MVEVDSFYIIGHSETPAWFKMYKSELFLKSSNNIYSHVCVCVCVHASKPKRKTNFYFVCVILACHVFCLFLDSFAQEYFVRDIRVQYKEFHGLHAF